MILYQHKKMLKFNLIFIFIEFHLIKYIDCISFDQWCYIIC